jgi:hypothetical protein
MPLRSVQIAFSNARIPIRNAQSAFGGIIVKKEGF